MLDDRSPAAAPITSIGGLIRTIGTDQFEAGLLAFLGDLAQVRSFGVHICSGEARCVMTGAAEGDRARCPTAAGRTLDRLLEGAVQMERFVLLRDEGPLILLCTASNARFTELQRDDLDAYASLLLSAVHQHLTLAPAQTDARTADPSREDMIEEVKRDLLTEGGISPREAEVCAYIALGYTINAISLNLGISENTAATHRKRAYSKLRISSQNELFARYFQIAHHPLIRAA